MWVGKTGRVERTEEWKEKMARKREGGKKICKEENSDGQKDGGKNRKEVVERKGVWNETLGEKRTGAEQTAE